MSSLLSVSAYIDITAAWYRNSYVAAYLEMEDVAVEIYEMALKPMAVAGAVLLAYIFIVAIGFVSVVVGHLILRAATTRPDHNPVLDIYLVYPLVGTLKLSAVGSSVMALPFALAWGGLSVLKRRDILGTWTSALLSASATVIYGMLSGASGSSVLSSAIPSTELLPVTAAMLCGALGGLIAMVLFIIIQLLLLRRPRKTSQSGGA